MKIYRPDFPAHATNVVSTPAQPADSVPLLDMHRQHQPLQQQINESIARVVSSGKFIMGPDCDQLEQNIATYTGAKHAIGCASGSDAILLALMALGIGPGDEVICPSYTFFATASAVWRLGAMPVFVDIDPVTYNMSPAHVQARLSRATKAIIAVHLYGQCCDMDTLRKITAPHGIPIIEDACQAIGAKQNGQFAGAIGDIGCFSFYPTKNLGGMGDGGMLTTNSSEIAARLKLLRAHGMEPRYYHQVVGINSRLDSIQAAILNVKMHYLNFWASRRTANAHRYDQLFNEAGLGEVIGLPATMHGCDHVWNQYIVRIPGAKRDDLRKFLTENKVGTEIYYPVPLHEQACFRGLGYGKGSLPESERAAVETLALPIFPELTDLELQTVVYRFAEFFAAHRVQPKPVKRPVFLDRVAAQSQTATAGIYTQYVVNNTG